MISAEEYLKLGEDLRHLVTVVAFWGEPLDAHALTEYLREASALRNLSRYVKEAQAHLQKAKWIEPIAKNDSQFGFSAQLSRGAYEAMLHEGNEKNWWPSVAVAGVASNTPDFFSELHRARYSSHAGEPSFAMLISEGVRLFASGSGAEATAAFRKTLSDTRKCELAQAIACVATMRFAEEPAFHLTEDDPLLEILPYWFSCAFLSGASVTNALSELHRLAPARAKWHEDLRESYGALCVWTGHVDWYEDGKSRSDSSIYQGLRCLMAGDLPAADALFKDWCAELSRTQVNQMQDALHLRALMAVAAAFAKPEKIAKKRPKDFLSGFVQHARYYRGNLCRAAWNYQERMARIGNWVSESWNGAVSADTEVLTHLRARSKAGPISGLVGAVCYHNLRAGRDAWQDVASLIWRFAKAIDRNGWSTLTRLLSALLAGGYDAQEESAYLQELDARALQILPRLEPEPVWKGFLSELEKAVAKSRRAQNRQSSMSTPAQRVVWYVALSKIDKTDVYTIDRVKGALHYTGDDGNLRDDDLLDSYNFEQKSIRKLMSENDLLIQMAREASLRSYYYADTNITDELVDRLCGAPNLINCKCGSNGWASTGHPMTLVPQKCEMTSSVNEDGGLVLSIPEWTLISNRNWCVRRVKGENYALVRLDAEARKFVSVFNMFGKNGQVTIPREGLKRAEPLVEALATMIPLTEPSADTGKIRRVPAAHDLRLRLDFTEGVLTVRAVILPVAENPNLTLDPGFGPAEKLIVGAVSSFVLVRDLAAEAEAFAPVRAALEPFESAFDGKSLWRFNDLAEGLDALQRIKALGRIAPLEWFNENRLSVVTAPVSGVKLTSQRTADDWFRVDGQFELDDGRVLSVVEFLEAAKTRRGRYVRLSDGDYVSLTDSLTRELDALNAAGRRKGEGIEIVKAAIPMLDAVFGSETEEGIELPDAMEVTAREIREAFMKEHRIPRTLNAELRTYQVEGYRWLSRLAACGFGSCLADDMGLGKTLQIIALLLERAANGASLVVAPSSVCGNWRRELERFAPTLNPVMAFEEGTDISHATARDVVIASYGYLLFHEDEFAAIDWNGLVLDEAQAIKNDASKRAKTVKKFHAKFRVAATGTPVENRLGELWSLFDFLNPGLLGPAASFAQRFTVDGKAVPQLKRLVKPLILRRLKSDVLDDLPEKTEVTIPVVMGKTEREAYEGCRQHALQTLASKGEEAGGANRMSILAELMRLRRFCCHPSLVLPGAGVPSAKMEALVELLDGLHESHHRALVFSQFTDYLAIVRKVLDAHGWSHLYLDGTTPTLEREKLVNAFQGGEAEFFIISLKAGGTGLNLTAANYVILLDPWWNPAVENQAADRAHRIGQKNPVTVYRLIASDTVEARVIELHQEKKAIAEDILEGTSSSSLTPAQLMKLFT